ncbi:hypothetical protein NECID01_1729 [Nematocida sp. AWRm77]|nr:hypothetical protein NECID01_1729 [Nematocida sp. AWRm77]
MKTIKVILILIVLITICICQIEVDFSLRNNRTIRTIVPKEAFGVIEEAIDLVGSNSDNDISPPKNKKAKIEGKDRSTPPLWVFEDEPEYALFRQLWDTSLPPLSDEPNPLLLEQTDISISAELFEKFLHTADYLDIQGKYAERFAENMVKYGLLSTYSAEIIASKVFSDRDLFYHIFWDFLCAFLRQTGFEYRVTHSSASQIMLRIEKANAWPKQLNKEYAGPFQETKMRTVLYSELGPASSQEKERNEAVLGWLLLNIGGSSVDIQYLNKVFSEDTTELSQTIEQFTKDNKKRAWVYVEGLSLIPNCRNHALLSTALQLVPNLSCLKLYISSNWISNEELSSLFSTITLCKSLKVLEIRGCYLDSVVVSILVESIPAIQKLDFCCEVLEDTAIESFKNCTQLEKLEIDGKYQPSATVQELVSYLPFLKELSINCEVLEDTAIESFKKCTHLEKLVIDGGEVDEEEEEEEEGKYQPSDVVQGLVSYLSSLKELCIKCEVLESEAIESFKNCPQLEKLTIYGDFQPSDVIQELVSCLPSLKELCINCEVLEDTAIESFKKCTRLEKLEIDGDFQPSNVVQGLVRSLSSLKELSIICEALDSEAIESFKNCTQLEKLEIYEEIQPSNIVQELVSYLPSLKELSIICEVLNSEAIESFKNCTRLEKLKIYGNFQPSNVVQELLNHLSSLKELIIRCEILEPEATEGFQACKNLKKLEICGNLHQNSSFLIKLLGVLPSLNDLKINLDTADLSLADALRKYPNMQSPKLTVYNYTPGFLARYLKDPLPNLKSLSLTKLNTRNSYSNKDSRAVEKASAMGMSIYLDSFLE